MGEYLASAIGHQLGLRVAEVQITHYDGLFCPLIWNFCNKDWVLKEGVDLTNTRGGGKYALSLPEIEEALSHTDLPAAHIKQYLTDLVCFDILIGNTDRHQHNWGILESSQSQLTAPFYDQGGAFGSSQHPERLKESLTDNGRMSVFDNRFRYEIRLSPGGPKPH